MADKGFDIKVLVPTDDGIAISEKQLVNVPYYLIYNISNRSYQLAGKIKAKDLNQPGLINELNKIIQKERVDFIICNSNISTIDSKKIKAEYSEINQTLHSLIDKIDQKKELL